MGSPRFKQRITTSVTKLIVTHQKYKVCFNKRTNVLRLSVPDSRIAISSLFPLFSFVLTHFFTHTHTHVSRPYPKFRVAAADYTSVL